MNWTRAKDKMPSDVSTGQMSEEVIIYGPSLGIQSGFRWYPADKVFCDEFDTTVEEREVTHWMPMPSEPTRDDSLEICIKWCTADIDSIIADKEYEFSPALTQEEKNEVLRRAKRYHDACIGISWDVLDTYLLDMYGEREKTRTKA